MPFFVQYVPHPWARAWDLSLPQIVAATFDLFIPPLSTTSWNHSSQLPSFPLLSLYGRLRTPFRAFLVEVGLYFNCKSGFYYNLSIPSWQCPAHPFWVPTHANKNMITEKHNLACRVIFKAISKTGSLGSCIVSKDIIGRNERMTMQNLRFSETAELMRPIEMALMGMDFQSIYQPLHS